MKEGFTRPVNYDKIWYVTQGVDENPTVFQGRSVEAIHKYTNLDPTIPEGIIILNMHFINQLTPDIRGKLPKMVSGPHTSIQHFLEVATGVFNNGDITVRQEKDQRAKLQSKVQAQISAVAIANPPQYQTHRGQGRGRL